MSKKTMFLTFFVCLCTCFAINTTIERQSAVFFNCDTQVLLDANTLQEIFDYVVKGLGQHGASPISVSYTEAGYTLLQALQKGGYLNLSVENSTHTAYINWLIQKSTTPKKSIATIVKKIKKALGASYSKE